jgi:hypothetical protein
VRARRQIQQYRCLQCGHQWSESRDPLLRLLRTVGIDARRPGVLKAIALFAKERTMSSIEQKTGVKSETLKRYLEQVRQRGLEHCLADLLKQAKLSISYVEDLNTFWVECEMGAKPYWDRGQWLKWRAAHRR